MRDTKGRLRGIIPTLAVLAAACASSGESEPSESPPPDEAGAFDLGGAVFVVQSGGLDELLSDPRDAGLKRAIALLDERLLELPEELGGGAPPPGTVEFLCEAMGSPWTLRVELGGDGPVPVRAQWVFRCGSAEQAAALAARFANLAALTGMPSLGTAEFPGLVEVETPAGSFFHGKPEGGTAFVLAWGEPRSLAEDLAVTGLPDGVRPAFAFGLDYGALFELVGRLASDDDGDEGDVEEFRHLLALFGLTGDSGLGATFAVGHGTDRAHLVWNYRNWTPMIERMGGLAARSIPRRALELVPDDASLVSISTMEPGMFRPFLDMADGGEALERIDDALGIDLDADLLQPLGQTFGFYLSDATGGGDLTSAVAFAAVDDEARLESTLDALATRLNELALAMAGGRLRVRSFDLDGTRGLELDFPGLPVPLSPALALEGGHLFVAATPQALAAALDQARGRARKTKGPSWRKLASARVGSLDDLQALSFVDSPRLARSGYGLASLFAAAFANAVRSPADLSRDPGPVLPPFAELLADVQPTVLAARVRGDDLVTVGSGDRSALAHVAATLGWAPTLMTGIVLVGSMVAIGTRGADVEAGEDEDPLVIEAEAEIWSLLDALDGWASENDGRYPEALEALVEPDEEGLAWLAEIPLDPWGNPYVYEIDGELVRVKSYGADGVPGGEGAARDIDSDELLAREWEEDEEWTEDFELEEYGVDDDEDDEEMEDD
jgi:general secretion pathway protein G